MSHFVVDVESDGPLPGVHNMINFGIIKVDRGLKTTFYGEVAPLTTNRIEAAAAVSGISRETHESFPDPKLTMQKAKVWIKDVNNSRRPTLWSDNNGYDAAFMNYYFLTFAEKNPFGWSSRRIGDLFCGLNENLWFKWRKYRQTKHTHHPVDDAKGNAEALVWLQDNTKLKFFKE